MEPGGCHTRAELRRLQRTGEDQRTPLRQDALCLRALENAWSINFAAHYTYTFLSRSGTQAIRTSPKYPKTVSFDLADLGRHNILEHDISLRYVMRSSSSNQY